MNRFAACRCSSSVANLSHRYIISADSIALLHEVAYIGDLPQTNSKEDFLFRMILCLSLCVQTYKEKGLYTRFTCGSGCLSYENEEGSNEMLGNIHAISRDGRAKKRKLLGQNLRVGTCFEELESMMVTLHLQEAVAWVKVARQRVDGISTSNKRSRR